MSIFGTSFILPKFKREGARDFSLLQILHTISWARSSFYTIYTRFFVPGIMLSGDESYQSHSLPCLKMTGAMPPPPCVPSMTWTTINFLCSQLFLFLKCVIIYRDSNNYIHTNFRSMYSVSCRMTYKHRFTPLPSLSVRQCKW